ncbi:MAG: hypothetical protein KY475_13025 [Planctomycetes bacterium]|nr:hypothetical protein [Planctomycetota bacterium]
MQTEGESNKKAGKSGLKRLSNAIGSETMPIGAIDDLVPPRGAEHSTKIEEKEGGSVHGGAKSGALAEHSDADLARLVEAWPRLSAQVRRRVIDLIEEDTSGDAQ